MQFKTMTFLVILLLISFTGCQSENDNSNKSNDSKSKISNLGINFTLDTIDGEKINLTYTRENKTFVVTGYPNKIILFNFFATWCPPCKAEIPNLIKLQNDHKSDFIVISMTLQDNINNNDLKKFIKDKKINYIVANGPDNTNLAKILGNVTAIPALILTDKNGKIFQQYSGIVPPEMMEIDIKKILEK